MRAYLSILFSENNSNEFIVLLTHYRKKYLHDIFLEEFREREFKRCFREDCVSYFSRRCSAMLFNPGTKKKTSSENIKLERITREPYYQVMLFKTTWKSEIMGLETEGWIGPVWYNFSSHEELLEDIERNKFKKTEKPPKDGDTDEASTSGYGSKSTLSKVLGSEKLETASSFGLQTMISGEAVTGQDLVDEVERAVLLRRKIAAGSGTRSEGGYKDIQAWLESSEIGSAIPDILNTEDLDVELGNATEKMVGAEGGDVSLRSHLINIPPNAVKIKTKFKFRVSVEMDLLEYPPDHIPVSLLLYCSPGDVEFHAPIFLKLPTWARKADLSSDSPPIPVYVYTKRTGNDWQCVKSAELSPTGMVEFECDHFCVFGAFIKKSDAEQVTFSLEHILFRDNRGIYTSCHFLSSDAFANAMLQHLERNCEILHSPTYTSLAKHGDQIRIKLLSRDPENYRFEASDDECVLTIDENLYVTNRRESFSFLLTPDNIPPGSIEFIYVIGEKKFLKRDILTEQHPGRPVDTNVKGDIHANILVYASTSTSITQADGAYSMTENPDAMRSIKKKEIATQTTSTDAESDSEEMETAPKEVLQGYISHEEDSDSDDSFYSAVEEI